MPLNIFLIDCEIRKITTTFKRLIIMPTFKTESSIRENIGKRIAMACYCDPSSVPDYLDGNSADAWSDCVLDADPDTSADDISNAICEHI